MMPEFKVRERALLESLHRFGVTEEGCIQAWFSFPHSMRIFYVHAYSSKIWNEAVSYRLATYGSRVVEGDLVCLDEDVDNEQLPSSKVSIISSRVIMYQEHLFSETLILEKIYYRGKNFFKKIKEACDFLTNKKSIFPKFFWNVG